jgi:ribonuclease HI
MRVTVATDGAARGNPGPAGIGAVVTSDSGEVLARLAEGIGVATNNVAEYRAAIEGLRAAAEIGATEVVLRADSRLLIEQLAGRFRVRNPTLQRLHADARAQMRRFERVRLVHVARNLNADADRAANEGVDAWLASHEAPDPAGPDPSLWEEERPPSSWE